MGNKDEIELAMIISAAIRRNIEGFHAKHIPDEHMKELNTLVRDAVYSTILCLRGGEHDIKMLQYLKTSIPKYWENPKKIF